jgi:ribosomal protein L7Ae-like RNA K-turn-binding protein
LCFQRLNPSPADAASLLSELIKDDEADALFSLSLCNTLPGTARADLISLGLEHTSQKVRHKAAHSILLAPLAEQEILSKKAKAQSSGDEILKAILSR